MYKFSEFWYYVKHDITETGKIMPYPNRSYNGAPR